MLAYFVALIGLLHYVTDTHLGRPIFYEISFSISDRVMIFASSLVVILSLQWISKTTLDFVIRSINFYSLPPFFGLVHILLVLEAQGERGLFCKPHVSLKLCQSSRIFVPKIDVTIWQELQKHGSPDIVMALVGNKADRHENREVPVQVSAKIE